VVRFTHLGRLSLFGTALNFEGSSYLTPPSCMPIRGREGLPMASLSDYERASLQKRLTQIELEITFPKLTEGQRNALDDERLTLLYKLGAGVPGESEHRQSQLSGSV